MSGRRYQVFMAPSAHRRYKKFDSGLQKKIKEEAKKLSEDPHIYEELKGPLRGIRSYHFDYSKTQYRIAYRILEDKKEIEVVLAKPREGFYQTLRRIIKSS
jgi:mRNA-degrading endonuclease RelE of RelBE toxin-antitoxin system